ncbi:hypothetical protein GGH94_000219 [Coemansia aciculifera]|uniref:Uncharacterized protein n=1 Tax=Coemansia aciculifera TaxID=417176 RepID=A0A9W8M7G7_9FUNG|nr:hypothetical protein GGH94_000219 [Coemansia aciculifera]KAJ2877121.1 hypothetical protein GGH93_000150 [Coemansia aciculifera]
MHTLSAFQLLPPHVVRKIVDHVAGSSRMYYDGVRHEHDVYSVLQMPLLWVCHNFRDFVYRRYCRNYELNLDASPEEAVITHLSWPHCLKRINHASHHLAKELTIRLSVWYVYSGKSLQLLSCEQYVGCAFPSVRKLSFHLLVDDVFGPIHDEYPPNTEANIAAFVRRMREMAPMVNEVRVANDHELGKMLQRQGAQFVDLVRRLFGIVDTTVISGFSTSLLGFMHFELVCNLVCLEFWVDSNVDEILSLIRRNTPTLQTLEILLYLVIDFTGLFRNPDDGGYLEYPCLHTLKLVSFDGSTSSQMSTRKSVVPFPRLRKLVLSMVYPFGDDVLFRGNATTFEYVKLVPCTKLVEVLKQYKVFTPTSRPKLQCVIFNTLLGPVSDVFVSTDTYLRFALSIAPGASVREIPNLSQYDVVDPSTLSMLGDFVSVQVLSIPHTRLSIWDAIMLIKLLPLLSDLHTRDLTLGELPRGIKEDDLPDYVRTTYAPMGKRFRCWEATGNYNYEELATCALLLALVCPNFDYAAVDRGRRKLFMEAMKEKIDEPGFRQDAPRLQRLLFNGWNKKQD